MRQCQIAVVVGSLHNESFNCKLASATANLASAEFAFKQIEIGDLPLYNQLDRLLHHTPIVPIVGVIPA